MTIIDIYTNIYIAFYLKKVRILEHMPRFKEKLTFESEPQHDNPRHAGMTSHRKRSEASQLITEIARITHLIPTGLLATGTKSEKRFKRQKNRSPKNPT